jgi:hypothetical protein
MRTNLWVIAALIIAHGFFIGVRVYGTTRGVDRLPEKTVHYSIDDLRKVAASSREYLVPFLFPLDLIVMLLLSGSLAWAAFHWGPYGFNARAAWAFALLPLAYLVSDLAEDGFLALLLSHRVAMTDATLQIMQGLTRLKFATIILAELQFLAAAGSAFYRAHWG